MITKIIYAGTFDVEGKNIISRDKETGLQKKERRGSCHHIQTHSEITLSAAKAVRKYEIDVCIPLVGSIVVACPPLVISSGRDSRSASRISHRAYGTRHDFLSR